jgi:predicted nucleic acid-binding protein
VAIARILLDTSAYSAFKRGQPEVGAAVRSADGVVLNPVVVGELLAGFARGHHRRRNERELDDFLSSFRVSIAPIDEETATRYATVLNALRSSGTLIPTNDIWIAATAMQHGCRIVTTDAHYQHVAQVVVDLYTV